MMAHEGHVCGCCGGHHGIGRRGFFAAVGGAAFAAAALSRAEESVGAPAPLSRLHATPGSASVRELVVQPVLAYQLFERREATSWRPWGGLHTEEDVAREIGAIDKELAELAKKAGFPIKLLPLAKATSVDSAKAIPMEGVDVSLLYGATSGGEVLEALISPERYNLLFVRHRSGPVYLWYEIAHPRLLRKTVDEYGQPGLSPEDVVVDDTGDLLWRLRALYALKNTLGCNMVVIGGASGWGEGGREAPKIAAEKWKMNLIEVSYPDLGKRIQAARADSARMEAAEKAAAEYLAIPGTELDTQRDFVVRAFMLTRVFEDLMQEASAGAMTINNCMSTIMPMAETTACLPLSVINDSGQLAFCESDFVVIPSGVLLHHVSGLPVFLQDPTYPHHGMVTLAHCTAPRKMDGRTLEKSRLMTHFESDYGAAPKVDMRLGETVTVIDPDFGAKRWIGFRGKVLANPLHDICRSQVDVSVEGDCDLLAREMVGFHWMLSYGDHLKELGYALGKVGIEWLNLSSSSARAA